jgi:hypothetical protein
MHERPRSRGVNGVRGMHRNVPPSNRGRREDRAPAGAHGPRAGKKHAAEPQAQPGIPGLPCAMVLRLIRDLPGDHAWLPPSPARCRRHLRDLSACIGAPEPRDFAVRDHIARLATCRVHRIPRSTSVTTAKRPSCERGTRQEKPGNQTNAKPIFFAARLDDPNQSEGTGEIRFLAPGISDGFGPCGKR